MDDLADPIAVLKAQHETILGACRTTETIARALLQHQAVEPGTLFEQVQFFRRVVDGQHRHREEDLLFPLLQGKHIGKETFMNKSLLDYEEGRFWIRSMDQPPKPTNTVAPPPADGGRKSPATMCGCCARRLRRKAVGCFRWLSMS